MYRYYCWLIHVPEFHCYLRVQLEENLSFGKSELHPITKKSWRVLRYCHSSTYPQIKINQQTVHLKLYANKRLTYSSLDWIIVTLS